MAVYKWRVPMLSAVQYDGKNDEEIKTLIGDDSGEEGFHVWNGEYEEPEAPPTEPEPPVEGEEQPEPVVAEAVEPAEPPEKKYEDLAVAEGDWVTKDVANGKVEVNPEGFPEKYEFISG
jgi:hypothetical protein